MKKKINIYAKMPFSYGKGIIRGNMNNITLDIEGIRQLILAKNIVDEILPNGELLRLDLTNYNTNNDPAEKARIEAAKAAAEAARILGLNQANIGSCCKGLKNHSTCGGFKFRFTREFETTYTPPTIKI